MTWLAFDMDEGVLGAFETRRLAVAAMADGPVLHRHSYGPGCYEYVFGYSDEDARTTVFVEREDPAGFESDGWDDAYQAWVAAGRPMGRFPEPLGRP